MDGKGREGNRRGKAAKFLLYLNNMLNKGIGGKKKHRVI